MIPTAPLTHPRPESRSKLILPSGIHACLFDLDGVLTDTAAVHFAAWKATFDAFLRERARRGRQAFEPFTRREYEEHVDGRQRFDGVRSFLRSRGIDLPEGSHRDAPGADTIGGLANRKNELVLARIRSGDVRAYPGSVRFVGAAREAGLRCAVVSASANCREVLGAVGLADMFEARVDGLVVERERLAGKPAPDMFLLAARMLEVPAEQTAVLEDAIAGVAAGRAGGFGLVVGVDRAGQAAALRESGAHLIVADLADLLVPT